MAMCQGYSEVVAVVPFVSTAGDVIAVDPEIEYLDDLHVRVRFMVDPDEWARLEAGDVFGSRSRRRFPDVLPGDGPVRVTVEGSRHATESPRGWDADEFVVVSAMRSVDDRWQGLVFASPPAWHRALEALVELGFAVDGETDDEISATNHLGVNVMISVYERTQVASVVYAAPIDRSWCADVSVLDLVNRLNASFVIGSLALSADDMGRAYLLVRSGVPILDGVDVAVVLEALVIGLTGMIIEVEPFVRRVALGEITVDDAVRQLV